MNPPIAETFNPLLLVGDPDASCACFSRFVLPFAYQLQRDKDRRLSQSTWQFQEAKEPDWFHSAGVSNGWPETERKNYLTQETRTVLYQRARWFVLRRQVSGVEKPVRDFYLDLFPRSNEKVRALLRAPGLVLFEFPTDPAQISEAERILLSGFLVLEAYFEASQPALPGFRRPRLADLLTFNEFFRYWQCPYAIHPRKKGYLDALGLKVDFTTDETPVDGSQSNLHDEAVYFDRWTSWLKHPLAWNGNEYALMPDEWRETARTKVLRQTSSHPSDLHWMIYADNRAYVWTGAIHWDGQEKDPKTGYCGDPVLEHTITKCAKDADAMPDGIGGWVKLLNVDQPGFDLTQFHRNAPFEQKWAQERTYKRWAHYGALYGYNYHCGALLTSPCEEPPSWRHFREIYFDQALLMLYIRVTLFRFSEQLTAYSGEFAKKSAQEDLTEFENRFRELRWRFTLFVNLYQFPLVSNQQQGVELYSLLRKQMDVGELYNEVKAEIENTHEFLADRQQQDISNSAFALTIYATFGLLFGIVVSFFSANKLVDPLIKRIGSVTGTHEAHLRSALYWVSFLILLAIVARLADRLIAASSRVVPLFRKRIERFNKT